MAELDGSQRGLFKVRPCMWIPMVADNEIVPSNMDERKRVPQIISQSRIRGAVGVNPRNGAIRCNSSDATLAGFKQLQSEDKKTAL